MIVQKFSSLGLCRQRMPRFLIVLSTLVVLNPVSAAFASGGGEHSPSVGDLAYPWVNFVAYLIFLYVVAAKAVKAGWISRSEGIRASVESSQRELKLAESLLSGIEESTRTIKEKQQELRAELVAQGEAEAAAIIADARTRAERIAQQAEELIQGEARSAQVAMRRELIAHAEQIARSRFGSGAMSHRDTAYVEAALDSAHRLVN